VTLAILICTLPERFQKLKRLRNILDPQVDRHKDQVFIQLNDAGEKVPTGTKRNWLIEQTQSDYFCFVDDDDVVASFYVDEIVKAMGENPDVITFNGWITNHGIDRKDFTIRLGSRYYDNPNHQFFHHRWPNHLAVMKRELVRHVKFPDIWEQEDFQWSQKIAERGLLKTEYHIPQLLYWYDCNPKNARYQKVRR